MPSLCRWSDLCSNWTVSHTLIIWRITYFTLNIITSPNHIYHMIILWRFSRILWCLWFIYALSLDFIVIIFAATIFDNQILLSDMHHIKLLLPRLYGGAFPYSTHLRGVMYLFVWLNNIWLLKWGIIGGDSTGPACHQFGVFRLHHSLGLVRHQIIEQLTIHLLDEFKVPIFRYVIFCKVLFQYKRKFVKLKSKKFFLAFIKMTDSLLFILQQLIDL